MNEPWHTDATRYEREQCTPEQRALLNRMEVVGTAFRSATAGAVAAFTAFVARWNALPAELQRAVDQPGEAILNRLWDATAAIQALAGSRQTARVRDMLDIEDSPKPPISAG